MAGNPRNATVRVVLKSDKPLDFEIHSDDLPKDANGDLLFENDHHPGFKVEFKLEDVNNLGYLWPLPQNKEEAVWSKLGAQCPLAAAHDVFRPINIKPDRKTLVVDNPNVAPALGAFQYNLRVTKTGAAPYLDLDPGGLNQNGPISRSASSTVAAFVAGAVVGSLLTLGTQTLLSS